MTNCVDTDTPRLHSGARLCRAQEPTGEFDAGSPQHGFNPLDYLTTDSPGLVSDARRIVLDFWPTPPN